MSKEIRKGNYIVSSSLKKAIAERLENNQQVILLLNRRGYTPIVKCGSCGQTITCPHCDIALSYHKDENKLVCHCCGYSVDNVEYCPSCGNKTFRNYGIGTQRLAEEIQNLFPSARIIRMDADSTKLKDSHEKILSAFGNHEYYILIGTQMISKGLDYPDVTLVGIFNADGPLNRSDYRSVETTFDLIVQASGRSGRASKSGEVYVQAYDISHYGIQLAVKQDYLSFFNNEMKYRHIGKYPPYSYMAAILFSSKNEILVDQLASAATSELKKDESLKILGPSSLVKKKDEIRKRIIIKSMNKDYLINVLWNWLDQQKVNKSQVSIQVDVDPYVLD